jgi:hypothetical protein
MGYRQIQNSPASGGGQHVRLRDDEKPKSKRLHGKKVRNRINRRAKRY